VFYLPPMVNSSKLSEELRRIKKLIADDPKVKARFDLDGDGHIDGFEWEQVRQLVIQRLERAEAEAAEARSLGAASQPPPDTEGQLAQQIFAEDLRGSASDATSLGEAEDFVLTQLGGIGQVFEGLAKREYAVHSASGTELGAIRQQQSDVVAGLSRTPLSGLVLSFTVFAGMQPVAVFHCEGGWRASRLDILEPGGGNLGHVTWKPGLVRASYRVVSTMDRGAMEIKAPLFKPWTLNIKSEIGDDIGTITRGWSGLGGFLTGGNRMRIQVEPGRTTPNQRFALLAAALLTDLEAEERRTKD